MTGLTDKQAVLLELSGMLEMFTWKVSQARAAFIEDKASADYLAKVERGLANLKEWALQNGWRPEVNNQRRST